MNTKSIISTILEAIVSVVFCLAIGASLTASLLLVLVLTGISSINLIGGSSNDSRYEDIKKTLSELLDFVHGDRNMTTQLVVTKDDNLAEIETLINKIAKASMDVKDGDIRVYGEIMIILEKMASGALRDKISQSSPSIEINYIAKTINSTVDTLLAKVGTDINEITSVLEDYRGANFTSSISNATGTVSLVINNLGSEVSNMLKNGLENGLAMQQNAASLKDAVENLSTSSNQQAASLEQTAAAMEEMTGNVQSNAQKADQMARIAKSAGDATAHGTKLANNTFSAMNEIQRATASINEAVAVVENIAFQTNILSLNAAVEAATAGEAGKGFAVVAQEVRNLANRSAEAAKTIKLLAQQAASKSDEGMNIAKDMNDGFVTIAEKINETVTMVEDVSVASKEQMAGIEQINDAIAQLDQMTQANASVASQADSIANQTAFMAEGLVKDANAKQFKGKDAVHIPSFESKHKIVSTPAIKTTPRASIALGRKPVAAIANTHQAKPVAPSAPKNDDIWESF